jgi:hypothetical protein
VLEILWINKICYEKEAVARIYYFVQKVLPLLRQRENAQKLSWEASFPE